MAMSRAEKARKKRTMVLMVGAFPPPIHGLSHANARMAALFRGLEVTVIALDTTRVIYGEITTTKFHRAIARLYAVCQLVVLCARHREDATLYMGLSAGYGQLGEMLYPLVARIFGVPVVVHHHSFAYLDRRSRMAAALFTLCGARALHILLCDRMCDLIRSLYSVTQTMVLSNAALMDLTPRESPRMGGLRTLGFLGNVTLEKGIDRFLALVGDLRARNVMISGHVAGPLSDQKSKRLVELAVKEGLVTYHGPVYGEDKAAFLNMIDVLIFPSRYAHEAEPFVILEAFASGVPVIATNRGCIYSLVDNENGILIDPTAADLVPAVAQVTHWINRPEAFFATKMYVISRVKSLLEDARAAKSSLLAAILES